MGRAAGAGRGPAAGASGLSDILAGQPSDEALLAELYDLEHDEITDDLVFYREHVRRHRGAVADLGCGSGRLFRSFAEGGASRILGVDGSPALLRRAEARIGQDAMLDVMREEARLELVEGDVRTVRHRDRFRLVVLAGVIAHLEGPEECIRALSAAAGLLDRDGWLIVDTIGPGGLPPRDLSLSLDWERRMGDRRVIRRSALVRREAPDGLHVAYSTLTDVVEPDGTMGRLPAGFRLWYPSPTALIGLAEEAGLAVEAGYGSHDLDPLDNESERCIVVLRRTADPGSG